MRTYPEFRDLVLDPSSVNLPPQAKSAATPAGGAPRSVGRPAAAAPGGTYVSSKTEPDEDMPHIPLAESESNGSEWVKWVLVVLVALATAAVGFYLFRPR